MQVIFTILFGLRSQFVQWFLPRNPVSPYKDRSGGVLVFEEDSLVCHLPFEEFKVFCLYKNTGEIGERYLQIK